MEDLVASLAADLTVEALRNLLLRSRDATRVAALVPSAPIDHRVVVFGKRDVDTDYSDGHVVFSTDASGSMPLTVDDAVKIAIDRTSVGVQDLERRNTQQVLTHAAATADAIRQELLR